MSSNVPAIDARLARVRSPLAIAWVSSANTGYCHTHPAMAAFIIVTETPYAAVADKEGRFAIDNVPEGAYTVRVWNVDPSRRIERPVTIEETAAPLVLEPS